MSYFTNSTTFSIIALVVIGLILLGLVILLAIQDFFIYPGRFRTKPENIEEGFENINGSLFKKGVSKKLCIVFGGNSSIPSDFVSFSKHSDNYILIIAYPGYFGTPGIPRSETTVKYIDELVKKLVKNHGITETNFICHSIGCAIALDYLKKTKHKPTKVVLFAPFYNLSYIIHKESGIPLNIVRFVLMQEWDNTVIKDLPQDLDIVIYHGTNDKLIHHNESVSLSKLHKGVKLIITEDDHNSLVRKEIKNHI